MDFRSGLSTGLTTRDVLIGLVTFCTLQVFLLSAAERSCPELYVSALCSTFVPWPLSFCKGRTVETKGLSTAHLSDFLSVMERDWECFLKTTTCTEDHTHTKSPGNQVSQSVNMPIIPGDGALG